ncbi:MAG: DUF4124 domain-containing protein [Gammaproteobacteria bacterium]|nr:DUF4124 domain-containing protein [Gammaproteobacteria bacterium]
MPDRQRSDRQRLAGKALGLLACVLLVLSGSPGDVNAQGKLYKYTDESGQTVYSNRPPPNKQDAETVKLIGVKPPADTSTGDNLDKRVDESNEARKDEEFRDKIQAQEAEREAVLKKNCETARQNLRLLRDAPRLKTVDKDGNEVFIEDNERAARIEATQKQIADYCK